MPNRVRDLKSILLNTCVLIRVSDLRSHFHLTCEISDHAELVDLRSVLIKSVSQSTSTSAFSEHAEESAGLKAISLDMYVFCAC